MNQTSGTGSSREDRPPSEFAYSSPAPASKLAAVVQETVLNPEGRRLGGDNGSASSFDVVVPAADSHVLRRLFPGESDQTDGDFRASEGCELGHFTIEERIGSGGMGAVFRALDTRLQRVVALKVLAPSQSRDRASVLRFENEARAAARLDHENVARVFYVGEDRGLHFIAFEYVTGQNVRDLITRTGRLAVSDAVNYALQIAAALRHTAAAGVVHRDIKPSNIIITPSGRAKLVDLGLARKLTTDSVGDLTVAGTTLGTFDYISPEQARDPRNVDVRSDIYSLGCTLYHMLSGGPPYSSGTMLQKLLDHQSGHAPDLRTVNPQVPPALSAVCRKMMAGDPKGRHATPDELIRELAAVAAAIGLRPMPADGYVWARAAAPPSPRLKPGLIWAGSLAVVVILALTVDGWNMPVGTQTAATGPPKASPLTSRPTPAEADDHPLPPQVEPAGTAAEANAARTASRTNPEIGPAGVGAPQTPADVTSTTLADAGSTTAESPANQSPADQSSADQSPAAAERPAATSTEEAAAEEGEGTVATAPDGLEEFWRLAQPVREIGALLWGGEAPLATETPAAAVPVPEVPARPPFAAAAPFVLVSRSGEPNVYDSLAHAVEAAFDGDVIELYFDGPSPGGPTPPLVVQGKDVTIRGGFDENGDPYRPLIEFAADSDRNPFVSTRMVTVSGEDGAVRLENVEVRLTVRGEARSGSGRWALFALSDAEQVRLTGTAVTLVNPEARPLSVFDLRPPENVPPQNLEIMGMMQRDGEDGFSVELERCLVRGEADLVTIAHVLPGRITAADSAFALGAALLDVTGGVEVPLAGNAVRVELDHVTAVVGNGLLQLDLADGREATPLRVTARDSLFSSTTPGPLVQMDGDKSASEFEELLTWTGRDNVFDGFSGYWTIFGDDGVPAGWPKFASWLNHWNTAGDEAASFDEREIPAGSATVVWASPFAAKYKARSVVTARDLALDPAAAPTGALEGADGGTIGASVERLPEVVTPAGLGAARTSAADRSAAAR